MNLNDRLADLHRLACCDRRAVDFPRRKDRHRPRHGVDILRIGRPAVKDQIALGDARRDLSLCALRRIVQPLRSAREHPSSIVNRSRAQSQDEPSIRS